MTKANVRTAAVCAAVLALLPGCSSESDSANKADSGSPGNTTTEASTTTAGEFGEIDLAVAAAGDQADTACRGYLAGLEQRGEFPYDDFDPHNPDPTLLPAVGAWFAQSFTSGEDMVATIREIQAVDAEQQAQLDDFVETLEAEYANAHAQADAAAAGDVAGFTATLDEVDALSQARIDSATTLGATECAYE